MLPMPLPQLKRIEPPKNLSQRSQKKSKLTALHCTQRQVFWSPHRFRVVVCGRRWGKSRLALATGIMAAMGKLPNYTRMLPSGTAPCTTVDMKRLPSGVWVPEGQPYLAFPFDPASPPTVVFAMPTLKQCKKIFWKPLVNLLAGQPFVESINRAELSIKLRGDLPEIVCVGLNDGDGDRVRGFRIATLLADEWQDVKPHIWDEVLRPAMADTPGSIALFTGTPKGKLNHLYKFDRRSETMEDWAAFNFHTADNPFIPRAEIANAEATQEPRIFRQEWQASYEDFPGQVFDHLDDRHIAQPLPPVFKRVVLGVDWGDVNPALAVCGKGNDGVWRVIDTWYDSSPGTVLDEVFLDAARSLVERWGVAAAWCGHDRPASIKKWQAELGIPCKSWQDAKTKKTKAPSVSERWSCINGLFHHNRLYLAPHLTEFKDKCGAFHRKTDAMGNVLDEIESGQDDHEIDAMGMAIASEEYKPARDFDPDLLLSASPVRSMGYVPVE